ncbi:hypothetical protein [Tenacibaculum maritimum]|uniref:hypothetical protein n=1 Tax=Tenacibaculum maritimum TaxID=107401 RepID=UPI001E545392|nr:hypothetical protein [Tenacibaculum maritimum]MCD9584392.1 hypothetical protein [Tenacibaculum maritimum]MCD9622104.1 hypothetical protein [Tenacibaculum maritimum]MCD9627593.1 hypothetical protein [Tenacibaculum maritimum]MCD9631490.1 hypothetical protein [Tenacibaculum maritimum]MCD9632156.1 hypothetical protein [Tenacibaculum maritimum]
MDNGYTYDVNGNMTKDLNKGITNIIYNLFSIDESFFETNYELMKKHGIEVDIYATTILSKDKIRLLLQLLNKKENLFLFNFLEEIYHKNISLIIEGN